MKYTRLFTDDNGESHFSDVQIEFVPTGYVSGAAPLGLSTPWTAVSTRVMDAQAGWESDWHPSSARNLFVVLSGEWEVIAGDGESKQFATGSVLLVEDMSGKGHRSRVISGDRSVAIMIELAAELS